MKDWRDNVTNPRLSPNYIKLVCEVGCLVEHGKLNIIIDGQFGSTGKGLVASYLGWNNKVDIAVTNASMNAGHTFYIDDQKHITKHLPVSGIINKKSIIYLCAGAIIDPKYLMMEINKFNVTNRLFIHPRAAVIEPDDIEYEKNGAIKKIASTCSGVGSALIRKINRSAYLAKDNETLKPFVREIDLNEEMDNGSRVIMEVPQGFDLSINSGLSYPHCTSREITIEAAMADAQVHPLYLGDVIVVIRTYPIRVGNIIENGILVGDSGPFYSDSKELTWEEIGVDPEYTTNTKRIRRIATFSYQQYKRMIKRLRPKYVFLNFANYMKEEDLNQLLFNLPEVTHLCFGPKRKDIISNKYK